MVIGTWQWFPIALPTDYYIIPLFLGYLVLGSLNQMEGRNSHVKFSIKKQEKQKVIPTKVKEENEDYIQSTDEIVSRPCKRKKLVIPSVGNLWQPAKTNCDNETKEAIEELLKNPENQKNLTGPKISSSQNEEKGSALQFPGVEPKKESTIEDYANVPISEFGKALMRGLGWEEGKGVGRSRKIVKPVDFTNQKRTLGVTIYEKEAAEAERLAQEFKLGDYVEVIGGAERGKHSKILSISVETSRAIVRLPSDEMIDVALIGMKSGSREEFLRQRDIEQETDSDLFLKSKESKNAKSYESVGVKQSAKVLNTSPWLHQDLKVRIVSEKFLKGKYYCKKVNIVDIIDPFTCICQTDSGKLLENVPQNILETVVPKLKGNLIMLLNKANRFEVAELEERDSKRNTIICVTLLEKQVVTASFDEVCQYVGDVIR